uniref:Uncharacterized protein n=1 Tax=Anguilla anguilla TaxID=7936 RepID=A0A0E9X273_ANGAN
MKKGRRGRSRMRKSRRAKKSMMKKSLKRRQTTSCHTLTMGRNLVETAMTTWTKPFIEEQRG